MSNLPRNVDTLLEDVKASEIRSTARDSALRELFAIIQRRINTMVYDVRDQELILKILDIVLDGESRCNWIYSSFNNYFIVYMYHKLELFLELASGAEHSSDSKLWNIIGILGIVVFIHTLKS